MTSWERPGADYGEDNRVNGYLSDLDLREARLNARLFASLLDASDAPSLPARVFRELENYVNEKPGNPAHVEGAILALELAHNALESALALAEQLDGADIDEDYEHAYAARATIASYAAALGCAVLVFDDEAALEAIVGKRTLALAA